MKRDEVLDKAKEIIGGPRAEEYGYAFENFTRILEGWNIIVNEAHKHQGYITARHVALMMIWLKTARLLNSLDSEDGWTDIAGYAALGAECCENEADIKKRLDIFNGKRQKR